MGNSSKKQKKGIMAPPDRSFEIDPVQLRSHPPIDVVPQNTRSKSVVSNRPGVQFDQAMYDPQQQPIVDVPVVPNSQNGGQQRPNQPNNGYI